MNASDLLPAEFNVASWFVDRPVIEGRGAAPAFHCEDRVAELRRRPRARRSHRQRAPRVSAWRWSSASS